MRISAAVATIAVVLVTGCAESPVDPNADIYISGRVVGAEDGTTVHLGDRKSRLEGGSYSFHLKGRDTQDFLGFMDFLKVHLNDPGELAVNVVKAGGSRITFGVTTEVVDLPDLAPWEFVPDARLAGDEIRLVVPALPNGMHSPELRISVVDLDDNVVARREAVTGSNDIDARPLEDQLGRLVVLAADAPGDAQRDYESATVSIQGRLVPISRQATCTHVRHIGDAVRREVCGLTDGDLSTLGVPRSECVDESGSVGGCDEPTSYALIRLAAPVDVHEITIHGSTSRVSVSRDGRHFVDLEGLDETRQWDAGGLLNDLEGNSIQVWRGDAKQVKVVRVEDDGSGLSEVSVWPAHTRLLTPSPHGVDPLITERLKAARERALIIPVVIGLLGVLAMVVLGVGWFTLRRRRAVVATHQRSAHKQGPWPL